MQAGQQFKRIPLHQAARLPRLVSPAGYVIVIQDVDYGNRFKIARLQQIDRDQIRRVAELSIDTRLALILEAENAAASALALHDRFVPQGREGGWFDLEQAQLAQLDDIGRPQAMSLRELAHNEMGGESLVQDAKIVRTTPQTPIAHLHSREKPRGRPWLAWLFLLLIVAGGALIALEAPLIRREITGLLNALSEGAAATGGAQATVTSASAGAARQSPAASTDVPGQGEVYYVRERAHSRTCASTSCGSTTILEIGTRIETLSYHVGDPVAGDRIWIKFLYEGAPLYIHQSTLSLTPPVVQASEEPTALPELSPTAAETGIVASALTAVESVTPSDGRGHGEVFYVRERARARPCASTNCRSLEILDIGTRIVALSYHSGQTVAGSDTWIRFLLYGSLRYVHLSSLSETATDASAAPTPEEPTTLPEVLPSATEIVPPTEAATATEPPAPTPTDVATLAATATDASAALLTIETQNNLNARVRSCPSTSCEIVGRLSPGDQIQPTGQTEGENINGIDLWVEFVFDGETAYVHGELVTEVP